MGLVVFPSDDESGEDEHGRDEVTQPIPVEFGGSFLGLALRHDSEGDPLMHPSYERKQGQGRKGVDQGPLRQSLSLDSEELKADAKHQDAPKGTEFSDERRVHALACEGECKCEGALESKNAEG